LAALPEQPEEQLRCSLERYDWSYEPFLHYLIKLF